MAFDYYKTLKRIIAKANLLEERYAKLVVSRDKARAEAEELRQRLDSKERELEKLKMELDYLKIAHTIAPNREQIEAARAIITDLVRDIDRCITDLSD